MEAALFLISRTLKYKQLAVRSFVLCIFAFIYAIILASLPLLLFISAARRLSLSCEVVHGAINTPQHASLGTEDKLEEENK